MPWESLIANKEDEPLVNLVKPEAADPTPAHAERTDRRPPWMWPAVAVVALLGLFAVLAMILTVNTQDAIAELVNPPEDAQVLVDGNEFSLAWPEGDKPAVITVTTGKHRIKVKEDGLETSGEEVIVHAEGKVEFTIRLLPRASSHARTEHVDSRQAQPAGPEKVTTPADSPGTIGGVTYGSPRQVVLRSEVESRGLVISASWMTQGNDLVQTSPTHQIGELLFGDPNWSHYDLFFEVTKDTEGWGEGGGTRFTTFFHWLGTDNKCWYSQLVPPTHPAPASRSVGPRRRCLSIVRQIRRSGLPKRT